MTLKEIRLSNGLTLKELSEKSGVNVRQIQKYESAECSVENMTVKSFRGISNAFGYSMDELINLIS